jgi:hydroxyacylglutathione hydrolase
MKIHKFTVGNFAVNNYLVHSVASSQAILFDAGEDAEVILKKIDQLKLDLKYLVNTHGHCDHIAGNKKILQNTDAQLLIHQDEIEYLNDPVINLSVFFGINICSPPPDRLLKDGDKITLDTLSFHVIHTPGHTPGHISVISNEHAFVGDVIFQGSVGRVDFPKASGQQLIESIRDKIFQLPDSTLLYPGHGPNTSVKEEKKSNPFVNP